MLKFTLSVVVLIVGGLFIPAARRCALEGLKAFSDALVAAFLRVTSQFESELTRDGREEQKLWREQRLRSLRGLALRSEQKRKGQANGAAELP